MADNTKKGQDQGLGAYGMFQKAFGSSKRSESPANTSTHGQAPGSPPATSAPTTATAAISASSSSTTHPAGGPTRYAVSGTVYYSDGKVAPSLVVLAYDRNLRNQKFLGKSKTFSNGTYLIYYTKDALCKGKDSATLSFCVQDEKGNELYSTPLSDIVFNAPAAATVDITIPRKPAPVPIEYAAILRAMEPILECSGLKSPADLVENDRNRDITVISRDTGFDAVKITYIAVAFKLSNLAKNIVPEFYYALLTQGALFQADPSSTSSGLPILVIDLTTPLRPLFYDVVLLNRDTITSAVKAAVTAHSVSTGILERLPSLLKAMDPYKAEAQKYRDSQAPKGIQTELERIVGSVPVDKVVNILTTDSRGDLLGSLQQLQEVLTSGTQTGPKTEEAAPQTEEQTPDGSEAEENTPDGSETEENAPDDASTLHPSFLPQRVHDDIVQRVIKHHKLTHERDVLDLPHDALENVLTALSKGKEKDTEEFSSLNLSHADNLKTTAVAIQSQLERKYPTTAFFAALRRDQTAFKLQREDLLDFYDKDRELDLATVDISSFFSDMPKTSDDAGSSKTTAPAKATISSFQRLFKITPQYHHVKTMMDSGVTSGSKIHSIGLQKFEKILQAADSSVSKEKVHSLFNRATNIAIAASIRAGDLASTSGATRIAALRPSNFDPKLTADDTLNKFPNLKTLFQFKDFCACSECRTVHSAAAYVADTLHYLSERTVTDSDPPPGQPPDRKAKDLLFARRPDLGDMDLSCDNTNITLPYIDVVCELLEDAIAPDKGIAYNGQITTGLVSQSLLSALNAAGMPFTKKAFVTDANTIPPHNRVVRDSRAVAKLRPTGASNAWTIFQLRQTYGPQDQVEAVPQYINQNVYANVLRTAEYAFGLPFSLAQEECSAYFQQFAVSRVDLMTALQTPAAGPTAADIAAEVLGFTTPEYVLVDAAQPSKQDTYWNTGAAGTSAVAAMSVVGAFVDKTGLSYPDLQKYLTFSWINPSNKMYIKHIDTSCDLAQKRIAELDNDALDRFHRFIRITRKTSIPAVSLNRLIMAKNIGNGYLGKQVAPAGGDSLLTLSELQQIRTRLSLPWDVISYMFDVISTDGDTVSPYSLIFLNSSKNGKIDEGFTPANLAPNDAVPPPITARKLTDKDVTAYLALSLGTSVADMEALVSMLGDAPVLNLRNVTCVYALVKFAQGMRISKQDLEVCHRLTGSPDILNSPAIMLKFMDEVDAIRASGVKPKDLQYFLFHEGTDLASRELGSSQIDSVLAKLRDGYDAAAAANASPYDAASSADINMGPASDLISKLPGLSADDVSIFKAMMAGTPWSDPTMTAEDFINAKLNKTGFVADTSKIVDAQKALAAVPAGTSNEGERKALIKALADSLAAYFLSLAKNDTLTTTVSGVLKIPDDLTPVLLQNAKLTTPAIATPTSLEDILEADFKPATPTGPDPVDTDNKSRALKLLQTLNAFVPTLGISPDRVKWMFANNSALGIMQLDRLRYQDDASVPSVAIESWFALQDVLYLINTYPDVENAADPTQPFSVYGMFDLVLSPAASVTSVLHYFAQLSGLDEVMLTDVSTLFSYGVADFKSGATYRKLEKCCTLLRTLGLSVEQGRAVSKGTLGPDDATTMRQALKARYDEADWLGILKSIQDPLRRRKRDSLINYLLATNPAFQSADDLYDYYLIDVQMGSCMDTSRVVQAHATIQLFVQRCLLGLEPHSVASTVKDPRWAEWNQWMANYRLWELNKKLYLFPHAFLDQGVRKYKSEPFVDFESSLQQDQLTDSSLDASFGKYLEDLQGLAHLDVMTCYYQTDTLTMHVFARTKGGDPPVYYHREFRQERSWTPWDTVNVDITGDTLMVFDRNNRLTMAWPVFTEEGDPAQSSQGPPIPESDTIKDPGKPVDKVRKRWKIQLAVSERVDGKWTSKKVSREALYYPRADAKYPYIAVDDLEGNYPEESFAFFPYSGASIGQAIASIGKGGWLGAFALTGCSGYPEATQANYDGPLVGLPLFEATALQSGRFVKSADSGKVEMAMEWILSLGKYMPILNQPELKYVITYPLQIDLVDIIVAVIVLLLTSRNRYSEYAMVRRGPLLQFGTFMPFFYGDADRAYTIIPGLYDRPRAPRPRPGQPFKKFPTIAKTYSDLFTFVQTGYNLVMNYLTAYVTDPDPNKSPQKLLQKIMDDDIYKQLVEEYRAVIEEKLIFRYRFRNFYHPLVCPLRIAFNKGGIPGLMDRKLQLTRTSFNFTDVKKDGYDPAEIVYSVYPVEDLDFDPDGSYAGYNWELFFHCVYQVAGKLNEDQQFAKAQSWYHYIFNPLGASGDDPAPKKYWVTKPFQLRTDGEYVQQRIDTILGRIAADPTDNDNLIDDLKQSILDWRANPFDPWSIASTRTVEYQIATVLAYVKNLCDWGDSLFRQFTREAITQATQLYILAHKLLGPKPRVVAPAIETPIQSYNELESKIDLGGNALVDLEHFLPDLGDLPHGGSELPPLPFTALYFCIPPDDNLLSYWDLVDDRLTKIRTCRNIDGVEASLALFSPPIDFGALSRALAGGGDVSSFLAGLNAPLPNYRFQVMIEKARDLAAFAASLGNALLDALEKKDAEAMARLRSQDQLLVLKSIRDAKVGAIKLSKSAVEGLALTKAVSQTKYNFYSSQSYMNAWEITATALAGGSLLAQAAIALGYSLSGGLKLIPSFMAGGAGFGGSPTANVQMGGQQAGGAAEMAVQTLSAIALGLEKASTMASTQGSYQRRQDEWNLQRDVAAAEMADVDGKAATAKIQYDNAILDLATHDKQNDAATAEDEFLHSKYTNMELYDWMARQTSQTYRAAYNLAFDTGRKAERCYQLELGRNDTFLTFGFDSLKKGLKAADSLQASLNALQASYLENNKREYEISKDISLRLLDPHAFMALKATGKTTITIPEAIFDLDYPGQYMRRHKSVGLSIPCVTGPYTSVSCKLTLLNNRYRRNNTLLPSAPSDEEAYYESGPGNDTRFAYNIGSIQSVATSTCVADSGLFQLNFGDDRYLPFEGTGCIANWALEFPTGLPTIDYSTIADVILHVRYTSREGGSGLADSVRKIQVTQVNDMLNSAKSSGLFQLYSLRQAYPAAWNSMRNAVDHKASLTLAETTLPLFVRKSSPTADKIVLFARMDASKLPAGKKPPNEVKLTVDGEAAATVLSQFYKDFSGKDVPGQYRGTSSTVVTFGKSFTLQFTGLTAEQLAAMEDVVIVVHYTIS